MSALSKALQSDQSLKLPKVLALQDWEWLQLISSMTAVGAGILELGACINIGPRSNSKPQTTSTYSSSMKEYLPSLEATTHGYLLGLHQSTLYAETRT
jgi:hypothetical protein